MRLSFRLCVFILVGLLILPACAEVQTPPTASPAAPTAAPVAAPTSTATAAAAPAEKTLRFVEFYSPMWSTCREVLPIVNGLEKEYGSRIDFQSVNIHNPKNNALVEQFGFTTAPELYLVDAQGSILGAWDGTVTEEELRQAFETALQERE